MSSHVSAPGARRAPTVKRSERIDAVVDAAIEELRAHGYEGLTVRNAASRAGVAAATAYTYFGSKDHLVAEVFWRRLQRLEPPSRGLTEALRDLGRLIAEEPELAAASTTAILAQEPDVERLRTRIGAAFDAHLAAALGADADADADPMVLRALNLALAGALLQAGMGYLTYTELAERVDEVATLIIGPHP